MAEAQSVPPTNRRAVVLSQSSEMSYAVPTVATAEQVAKSSAADMATSRRAMENARGAINFLLEFTSRFPDPVWRVMWGESAGSAVVPVIIGGSIITLRVAQRLFDRSHDLMGLANDALSRKSILPAGPALVEPLNDDRRDHPDHPAQKIRHPRNVRILPPSRDFH